MHVPILWMKMKECVERSGNWGMRCQPAGAKWQAGTMSSMHVSLAGTAANDADASGDAACCMHALAPWRASLSRSSPDKVFYA